MTAKLTTAPALGLAIGIALMAAMPTVALAGGDYYAGSGSVKDYGGTPVPAPIPVPMYDPVWYFRADVGVGFGDGPSGSESGMVFGEAAHQYEAVHSFGAGSINGDYDNAATFAVGVGYRWTDSFRTDLTAESLRDQNHSLAGSTRADLKFQGKHIPGYVESDVNDFTSVRGGALLLNAYYDLPARWGGFTPYVGAGLGFAMLGVDRTNTTTERVRDNSPPKPGSTSTQFSNLQSPASDSKNAMSLAAAVMLGTTYRISDVTELDFNYRYLYVDGVDATVLVNHHSSTVDTGGASDHELRAGVRFNIQ